MYRIEVTPGEETVFRTMEELAVAIRNGLVTPRARIYHNASQKWLPIGLHPHYKKAMELPAASAAHPTTPTPCAREAAQQAARRVRTTARASVPSRSQRPRRRSLRRVVSPVVAMQQEVLRDLPVLVIPEPLPWATRPATVEPRAPIAPAPEPVVPIAQPVQSQPTATVTYTPSPQPEPVQPEPVQPEPVSPWPHFEPVVKKRTRGRPLGARSARVDVRCSWSASPPRWWPPHISH